MGAIEDTRKVLQDFLAPEMRSISVRLELLEKRFDERIDGVEKRIDGAEKQIGTQIDGIHKRMDGLDARIESVDRRAEQRHEVVMLALDKLADYKEIRERLTRLESKEMASTSRAA